MGSSLRARGVAFVENQADGAAGAARQGGAVWAMASVLALERCTFLRNYAARCEGASARDHAHLRTLKHEATRWVGVLVYML